MAPQFKNMNELIEYLTRLEKRVELLENERNQLQTRSFNLKKPNTALLSTNFLKRSFAVWGHFITANFIISGIGVIIYLCVVILIINAMTNPTTPPDPATIPTPYFGISVPTP